MPFPTDLPTHDDLVANETLSEAGHSTKHNATFDELEALEAKVGVDSSAVTSSHDYKLSAQGKGSAINSLTEKTTPVDNDMVGLMDSAVGNILKKLSFLNLKTAILKVAYPVGSVYINASVSTNPATLFGFGTWVAFGAGKTLVSLNSGDTDFDTAEETGGAKTVNLEHQHLTGIGWDSSNIFTRGDGSNNPVHGSSVGSGNRAGTGLGGGYSVNTYREALTENKLSTAQSIVQPYIVTYMWKRTA